MIKILLERFKARKDLKPTYYEQHQSIVSRFLEENHFNLEVAYDHWLKFVCWRRKVKADDITDNDIKVYTDKKIGFWKGQDKNGCKCCIITGRQLNPIDVCYSSFPKFIIRLVEQGCLYNEDHTSKICVIYDRRGLKSHNIDPMLYTLCRQTIDDLTFFYGKRLSVIYVIETSWFFWLSFYLWKPFLQNKVVAVKKRSDLLDYFEDNELHLINFDDGWSNEIQHTNTNTTSIENEEKLREVKFETINR